MKRRTPHIDHKTAGRLAQTEYERTLALLRSLEPADWDKPTDCPAWTVRQLACHLLGAIEMAASLPEGIRQQWQAIRAGGDPLDALTGRQVSDRAGWAPTRIVETYAIRAPHAAKKRRARPALLRQVPLTQQRVNGELETWTLGYFFDVIVTRDSWLHRVDLSRATGRALELTADHDGVIVADVVAEWFGRHQQPVTLILDGPAGGRWERWKADAQGPALQFDADEFCRVLSGRESAIDGGLLLDTAVPF